MKTLALVSLVCIAAAGPAHAANVSGPKTDDAPEQRSTVTVVPTGAVRTVPSDTKFAPTSYDFEDYGDNRLNSNG